MWKFLKRTISEQESHQIWSFLKRKKYHIKCESSWKGKLLKRNRIKYDGSWKGQIWKHFITSNVKVPELEHFWKEITSYMIVLGKGKKSRHAFCRYVDMSICRCDSMWWQPLFGISGAWSAFFSPQSSRRSAMDTERNSAIWTPEFIIVHHSSSRIQ